MDEGFAHFAEVKDGEVHYVEPVENVDDIEDYDYGFNYHGTYSNWKELIHQNVGPIDGLMSGKFEVDSDMQRILQYSDGASTLATAAGQVDTTWPDE